ncbi:MAG: flagellar biosynthetic protein FliR [Bacillota bacterium]
MLDVAQVEIMLLILARMASFMVSSPIFSLGGIPALVKIGLAVLLTILLYPVIGNQVVVPQNLISLAIVLLGEVMVGLALGFVASLAFHGIRIAGELVDLHIGFSMANLLDPFSHFSTTLVGQFLYMWGTLLFLIINGHHSLLAAMARSYQIIPVAGATYHNQLTEEVVHLFAGTFALAFRVAAPFLAVLIISDLALGLIARTVPQLNVFMLGMPVKVVLALGGLSIAFPLLAIAMGGMFSQMEKDLLMIMGSLH